MESPHAFSKAAKEAAGAAGLDLSVIPARVDCFNIVRDQRGLKVRGWKVRYRCAVTDADGAPVYEDGDLKLTEWRTARLPQGWEPSQ